MSWETPYKSDDHARFYAGKHEDTRLKRVSNYFERRMVSRALRRLRRTTPYSLVLDCASGTGRFLPVLADLNAPVVALDTSASMLAQGRRFHDLFRKAPVLCVGSALELPLADKSVDVVLCSRLLHHFADEASRVQILREFGRVARWGVVVTFFDAGSYRGWRRARKRRRPGKQYGRYAVTRAQCRRDGEQAGLSLAGMNALLRFHTEITAAAFRVQSKPGTEPSPPDNV